MQLELQKKTNPNDLLVIEFGPRKIKFFATGEPAQILYWAIVAAPVLIVLVALALQFGFPVGR